LSTAITRARSPRAGPSHPRQGSPTGTSPLATDPNVLTRCYLSTHLSRRLRHAATGVENIIWCYLGGFLLLSDARRIAGQDGWRLSGPHFRNAWATLLRTLSDGVADTGAKFLKQFDLGREVWIPLRTQNHNVLIAWAYGWSAIDAPGRLSFTTRCR